MKKMWPVFVALCFAFSFMWVAGTMAIAMDQCEVVGNSYVSTVDDTLCTLTFVENSPLFSPAPRCAGVVYLGVSGNIYKWDWMANRDGTLTVAGLPAVLTSGGVEIYGIPTISDPPYLMSR